MNNIPAQDFFLEYLNAKIGAHLSDSSFTVERLLLLVKMGRTSLHRKLKRETGMSATQYIRHLRLQKAAELLKAQSHWTIYQIALEVGFVSHSYFTNKFKEQFGMCPLAYRASQNHQFEDLEHL